MEGLGGGVLEGGEREGEGEEVTGGGGVGRECVDNDRNLTMLWKYIHVGTELLESAQEQAAPGDFLDVCMLGDGVPVYIDISHACE